MGGKHTLTNRTTILIGNTEKAGVLSSLVLGRDVTPTQKQQLLRGKFSYTSLAELMA